MTFERKEWKGADDVLLVPIADITIPEGFAEADPDPVLVQNIAESIRTFGLIHPVAVRQQLFAFGTRQTTILVAGRSRLEAYKKLGEQQIPCTVFPDDEVGARFVRFSENLCRAHKTTLEEADEIAQLVEFSEQNRLGPFGQNVPKKGRPLGRAAKAAKLLPVRGKTEDARRKKIERALTISEGIYPQYREEIKKFGLDNDQFALLEIARADQPFDKHKAIQRLRRRKSRKASSAERMSEALSDLERAEYEDILSTWERSSEFRTVWRRADQLLRERFINEVLRGSSGVDHGEAMTLIKRAFEGRQSILVRDLLRLGMRYGLSKKSMHTAIRTLGYRKKRGSRNIHEPWSYMNTNPNWKGQLCVVRSSEFEDHSPPKEKEIADDDVADDFDDDDDEDQEGSLAQWRRDEEELNSLDE